ATVSLAYRSSDVGALPGFGFVVPAIERRSLLACTFASRKFAGRAPDGHELLRAFVGGARRPDLPALPDAELIELVRSELRALLGITADPLLLRVHRQLRAMPQYTVGHLDRVAAIEARVAGLPGLALAGAAYRGVGIPDCVRAGEEAADAVLTASGRKVVSRETVMPSRSHATTPWRRITSSMRSARARPVRPAASSRSRCTSACLIHGSAAKSSIRRSLRYCRFFGSRDTVPSSRNFRCRVW